VTTAMVKRERERVNKEKEKVEGRRQEGNGGHS
jgi:hypothetical protein